MVMSEVVSGYGHGCGGLWLWSWLQWSLVMVMAAVVSGKVKWWGSSRRIKACAHDLVDWLVSEG